MPQIGIIIYGLGWRLVPTEILREQSSVKASESNQFTKTVFDQKMTVSFQNNRFWERIGTAFLHPAIPVLIQNKRPFLVKAILKNGHFV